MADIVEIPGFIEIRLSRWEKWGSLHSDLRIPLDHITHRDHVPDLWTRLRGMRAPGTGFPGVIMLGTTRFRIDGRWRKDFCAVYGHRPGTVLSLKGEDFERVLISDPGNESQ